MFKKSLLSFAAAAALGMGVSSAHAVLFDYDGVAGGATDNVIGLDWSPDNALSIGALSTPPGADGTRVLQTVAQGRLVTFSTSTSGDTSALFGANNRAYTFQTSFFETATGIGSSAASFVLAAGANYFRMYADSVNDSNQVTGAGYGASATSVLILEGVINSLNGTFNDATRLNPTASPITGLDQFSNATNGDVDGGVRTHVGNGSNTINVDITFLNSAYFLGDVTNLILTLSYNDSTNLASPFNAAQPSDFVVGIAPSYSNATGGPINGNDCTSGGSTVAGRCDFHFQSDAAGSFIQAVPEPGSLALVGLALGIGGLASLRKKAA